MQLKTITAMAAFTALAQASYNGTWGDHTKAPVLDTTEASTPSATIPTHIPSDKPEKPVDGGKTDVADTTAASSTTTWGEKPVDGGKTDVADSTTETPASSTPTQAYWGDETSAPVDGGKTDVADSTAASSTTTATWGDETSLPVDGGKTDVADTTAASSTVTWGDHDIPNTETTTETDTKTNVHTTTVGGGAGGPPAETPVSGGQGKPPGGGAGGPPAPPTETPVSGDEGKPPGGGAGGPPAGGAPPAGGCGTVTTTITNVVTVTVPAGGHGAPPAPTTPVIETSTSEFSMTWADHTTGFETSAAPAPSSPPQGGYMGVVSQWRSKMGLSALTEDNTLQGNAQNAADSSGGQLKHKLNPGSMAQVMAPGDSSNFEDVFVGGWLCELPNTPGLGSSVCDEFSKGWNYEGQTGHAEILTSSKYSKIGCGLGDGIWTCDLA